MKPIDLPRALGALTRTVAGREHGGRPARAVIATRTFDTTIEDAWDAVTSAERIPRWFLPISGELRLGGRFQLQGNAGGEITRCDRPDHLAVTWEFGGEVSWVEVRLTAESAERTRLELEHVAHVDDDRWKQFGPGAAGVGWELALLGLTIHHETGEAVDPVAFMAWMESAEAKALVRGSSDGWRAASIAFGTDSAEATAAAERCAGFYTGEP